MAPGRVLVVEDDDGLRETLAELLADEGHEVRVAEDGQAALATIRDWEPELILLDLMMPNMDGFAFRERQRQSMPGDGAKILVLSAARDAAGAAERLGADDWLAKPFGLHEVLARVRGLLAEAS